MMPNANLPKLIGAQEKPVQIDESYFRGCRKYNRGRLVSGDPSTTEYLRDNSTDEYSNSDEDETRAHRLGTWVLGLC